jgi:hypothetical protein
MDDEQELIVVIKFILGGFLIALSISTLFHIVGI